MSSHAQGSREVERRLSVRTLIIASVASAMAAIIVSRFWTSGTPIAAAITPLVVTLVSELLNRPTEKIAQRFTTESNALPPQTGVHREAGGARPPPPRERWEAPPARDALLRDRGAARGEAPEFRVYGTPPTSRRLPWKPILVTAAIAFVIAAAALSLPELIAGQSVGKGDRNFTLWGGGTKEKDTPATEDQTQTQETNPDAQATQPETTAPKPKPEKAVPTVPKQTTPEPQATQPPAQTAPAPRSQTPAPQR